MKTQNLILTLCAFALSIASCNNSALESTTATLSSDKDTASYYIGYMYGKQFADLNFKELNKKAFIAGINKALGNEDEDKDMEKMNMFLHNFFNKLSIKLAEDNLEKGKKFMEENAKKQGVKTLTDSSSVQYKVIAEGNGAKPTMDDKVKVHYAGRLINGKEFDSSIKRGEPTEFFLRQVIPGWAEALTHMPVGSKWEVYIPSDLAYGPRGARGAIGPNETLIFEIELLDITTPKEEKK